MSAAGNAAFQKAVEDSKKLTSKPSNDDLLEFYGAHRLVAWNVWDGRRPTEVSFKYQCLVRVI